MGSLPSVLVEGSRNVLEELILPLPRSTPASAAAEVDLPALVDTYATTLFRVAHSLLRNRAEAEDAVQDTFLRVLQHQRNLPAVRELRPWLIRITWNLALDRRRRKIPDQADDLFLHSLVAPNAPADQVLEDAQGSRLVLAAMDRLPKAERQALLLSALDELPISEIAQIMQKSESAVRALLFRARTRLRERLQTDNPRPKGVKS
ncbi:MAG TPA: RNA polymerase sigma factor [Acidobacteriaceae bacterium]|nr:RNA polymerase sigma factor [Acidobacteriaceae bacterium]